MGQSTKIEPSLNKMKTCIKDGFACEIKQKNEHPTQNKMIAIKSTQGKMIT